MPMQSNKDYTASYYFVLLRGVEIKKNYLSLILKGGITLFYNTIDQKKRFCKTKPMIHWEYILQTSMNPHQWKKSY